MPLVRVEVRNEYAHGASELYREAKREDPKEILEGVAVSGLVGVLRQLGDLAEFAADVFHGLQEEVSRTSSRSHKLMARVQRIEAALSPLEKALLAQRSHLHFAYTAGSNWHTRIRCEQNHFIYSDVPQFIMDAYEDCRRPPSLHLLDKFDPGGPGSCLKRFSDPTFFKRASVACGEASTDKVLKDKKGRKIKKKRSWPRNGRVSRDVSFSYNSGRTQFTQLNIGGHASPSQTASTYDAALKSDLCEQSNLDLRNGSSYIEGDFRPSYSVEPEEQESRESISSPVKMHDSDFLDYNFTEEKIADSHHDIQINISQEQAGCSSSSVSWDGKRETLEPTMQDSDNGGITQEDNHNRHLESFSPDLDLETFSGNGLDFGTLDKMDVQPCNPAVQGPESGDIRLDDIESETDHFMDALNTIESECETDTDCNKKKESEHHSNFEEKGADDGVFEPIRHNLECQSSSSQSNVLASSPLINCNKQEEAENHSKLDEKGADDGAFEPIRHNPECLSSSSESNVLAGSPLINCNKKKEAEHHPKLEEKAADDGVFGPIRPNLECQSLSSESNVLASSPLINGIRGHSLVPMSPKSPDATNCLINEIAAKDEFNSVSLVDKDLQSSERARDSVSPSGLQSIDSHENGNTDAGNYVESVSSTVSSNFQGDRPGIPIIDGTRSSADSCKHAPETSNVTSVTFWTNGGLLGLQPSKPPDCSVLNALPQCSDYKKDGKSSSSIRNFILSDKDSVKSDQTSQNFKNIEEGLDMDSSKSHEYEESGMSFRKASWRISPADLDINLGKLGNSLNQNSANSTRSSVTASGSFLPVTSSFQADRKHQDNSRSSSCMFELSNRLLSPGSNKKLLLGGDDKTYTAGYKNPNAFERKNHRSVGYQTFSGRSKDIFGGEAPVLSPCSSPPLEHMKISFQPIDGFESSKLKLKFPDRNTKNESGSDIFHSFQLVPEVSIARYNVGSDSDADTFYRSSPSLSDDCRSNQSESNSEQWESSESPTSKDRDIYDALRRISLTESVSTLPENGRTNHQDIHGNYGLQFPFLENGVQNSESCHSFDLHSVGLINQSFRKELRNDTSPKDLVEAQLVATPFPPPLPPVQWRGMTSNLDATEDECEPEGSYYAVDLTRSASTISQPKPAPFNEDQIDMQKSKSSLQKSNGQREANEGKSMDETDFLHQIRMKSFNLRPTVAAKTTVPSGAPATVQVTAILQKANAIRQAVGSDGEDDGNWSDN